jgi:diguanylate cyclase (GGDEF)-like protein
MPELDAELTRRLVKVLVDGDFFAGVCDDVGNAVWMNDAFRDALGWPEDHRPTTDELFPAEWFTTYHERIRPHLLQGDSWQGVVPVFRRDGSIAQIDLTVVAELGPGAEVTSLISIGRDVTGEIEQRQELERQAGEDPLTGLPHRDLLVHHLRSAIGRNERGGLGTGVLFVDLDDFKAVNDREGHAAGDRLLRRVAERLERTVRPGDVVGRYGGDEFVLLCHDVEDDVLLRTVASRIHETLAAEGLHASVGLTIARAGDEPMAALDRADRAMYAAKRRSRGPTRALLGSPLPHGALALEIETALAVDATRGRFELAWEPIVGLADGSGFGHFAHLTWRHERLGRVLDAELFLLARSAGVEKALGYRALRGAVDHLVTARDAPAVVALPPSLVADENLGGEIAALLEHRRVDASRLVVAVPESSSWHHPDIVERLREVTALGVGLAVCEVGGGSTSLSMLTGLPFRLHEMVPGAVDSITSAAAALAREVGADLAVSRVQSVSEASRLLDLGASLGRGPFVSRTWTTQAVGPTAA